MKPARKNQAGKVHKQWLAQEEAIPPQRAIKRKKAEAWKEQTKEERR